MSREKKIRSGRREGEDDTSGWREMQYIGKGKGRGRE
jgi:hypothetical protein